jgi:nitrate/nitrite-specific signal transduction histidine kinase
MSDPRDWRTLLAAAMLEGDSTQLPARIEKAEDAIYARLRELPETFSLFSEQAELQSALQNLRRLKSNRLPAKV